MANLNEELQPLRQQIDAIDECIIELLNQRGHLSLEIGKIKKILDPTRNILHRNRELEILKKITDHNKGPFSNVELTAIYELIFEMHRTLQRQELE